MVQTSRSAQRTLTHLSSEPNPKYSESPRGVSCPEEAPDVTRSFAQRRTPFATFPKGPVFHCKVENMGWNGSQSITVGVDVTHFVKDAVVESERLGQFSTARVPIISKPSMKKDERSFGRGKCNFLHFSEDFPDILPIFPVARIRRVDFVDRNSTYQ